MKRKAKSLAAAVLLLSMAAAVFSTPAAALTLPVSEPKAPSGLTAKAWVYLSADWRVKLEWKDNSLNESGFRIYRRAAGSALKLYTLVDTVAADTTSYNDADAELGKTYYYYVTAYNTAGANASDTVSVAVTDTAPEAAAELLAVADSETDPTRVTVTWQDNSDNESGFRIYRRDFFGSTSYALIGTVLANADSYTDGDVDGEGTFYLYRVSAYNGVGETVSSPDNWSVPLFLKPPTGLTCTADGTQISLSWTDNSEKEDSYVIYRCTDGTSYAPAATVGADATSYTDSGLEANTAYYYCVAAWYEAEPQLCSPPAYASALTGDEQTPYVFPFTDVPGGAWYRSDVERAHKSGLINGKSATLYCPDDNMSIAEAIKLAACMHQLYHEGSVTLTNGSPVWYSSYVTYALANNLLHRDYEDYTALITRSEFVNIFYYALPSGTYTEINTVADGAIPDVAMWDPYASLIYRFYRAGILVGCDSEGNFNQSSNIMRSEVAAILTRMFDSSARKSITLT